MERTAGNRGGTRSATSWSSRPLSSPTWSSPTQLLARTRTRGRSCEARLKRGERSLESSACAAKVGIVGNSYDKGRRACLYLTAQQHRATRR
ncbi:unnamed protein product [Scytosiphon promiscuus]